MKSKVLKSMIAATITASLTACGGGGDSESGVPEGLWGGSTSAGEDVVLFVLDDGQTWGAYGSDTRKYGGLLQGNLSSTGSAVKGSLLDFSLTGTNQSNLNISGTVRAGSSMNLSLNSTTTAGLSFDSAYNTPASLAQIAGTYEGIAVAPRRRG